MTLVSLRIALIFISIFLLYLPPVNRVLQSIVTQVNYLFLEEQWRKCVHPTTPYITNTVRQAEQRYDDAAKAYEKLRELAPKTAEVHARLGLAYFQRKRFADAVPTLRQAIKLKPTLPNIDVLLGMSLSELGQHEEALPALQKGFKIAADPALKRSSGFQLQRAYTGLRQDDKAVEVALELTRLYPNDPEVL